jgi:hypothetical protein
VFSFLFYARITSGAGRLDLRSRIEARRNGWMFLSTLPIRMSNVGVGFIKEK